MSARFRGGRRFAVISAVVGLIAAVAIATFSPLKALYNDYQTKGDCGTAVVEIHDRWKKQNNVSTSEDAATESCATIVKKGWIDCKPAFTGQQPAAPTTDHDWGSWFLAQAAAEHVLTPAKNAKRMEDRPCQTAAYGYTDGQAKAACTNSVDKYDTAWATSATKGKYNYHASKTDAWKLCVTDVLAEKLDCRALYDHIPGWPATSKPWYEVRYSGASLYDTRKLAIESAAEVLFLNSLRGTPCFNTGGDAG